MTLNEVKMEFIDYTTPTIDNPNAGSPDQPDEINDPNYRGERIPVSVVYTGAYKAAKRKGHPDAKIEYECHLDSCTGNNSHAEVGYEANGNESWYADAAHRWQWELGYKYIIGNFERGQNYALRLLNREITRKVRTFTITENGKVDTYTEEEATQILKDYLTDGDYVRLIENAHLNSQATSIMWLSVSKIKSITVG